MMIRGKTTDGSARFIRAGLIFGADWTEHDISFLSEQQIDQLFAEHARALTLEAIHEDGTTTSFAEFQKLEAMDQSPLTAAPAPAGEPESKSPPNQDPADGESVDGSDSGLEPADNEDAAAMNRPKPSINTATFEQLTAINGIGDTTAVAIIEGRPWAALDELEKLRGVTGQKAASLAAELTV